MERQQTVFLVDRDPDLRELVRQLVDPTWLDVQAYDSASEFLERYESSHSGCVIVDVNMQGMSGLEFLQHFQQQGIHLPVIVIASDADVPMAVRAMQAGAVTFLEKPCQSDELWKAIQLALEKETLTRRLRQQRAEIAQRMAQLTTEERAVMEKMIEGKLNKQIATELDIGLRTVELRRANVLKKMEADSLAELVRLAMTIEFKPPQ